MKKFLLGFTAGILTYEALVQFVWVIDKWDEFTTQVDEKMGNRQWRVDLREKYKAIERGNQPTTLNINRDSLRRELERLSRDATRRRHY